MLGSRIRGSWEKWACSQTYGRILKRNQAKNEAFLIFALTWKRGHALAEVEVRKLNTGRILEEVRAEVSTNKTWCWCVYIILAWSMWVLIYICQDRLSKRHRVDCLHSLWLTETVEHAGQIWRGLGGQVLKQQSARVDEIKNGINYFSFLPAIMSVRILLCNGRKKVIMARSIISLLLCSDMRSGHAPENHYTVRVG